jgi:hypothetical protein
MLIIGNDIFFGSRLAEIQQGNKQYDETRRFGGVIGLRGLGLDGEI